MVILWIRGNLLRVIRGVSPRDSSEIAPGLFVGGQHYSHGLERMKKWGIGATLSLRDEADDNDLGVAMERHLWLRTIDETPPTLDQLEHACEFIQQCLYEDVGVYIHCKSGIGRAPTTAAAHLVCEGMSADEAWTKIRQKRPYIRPKNSQFEQLLEFEQVCKANAVESGPHD